MSTPTFAGLGLPQEDPGGLIDLPRGFRYRVVQPRAARGPRRGAEGGRPRAQPLPRRGERGDARRRRRPLGPRAGVLRHLVGDAAELRRRRTPWGTWITCEETRDAGRGFCFEVNPRDPESALSRTPITGIGVFSHEAIDLDPRTGIAYLTEDDFQGEIPDEVVGEGPESRVSFLYRFLPTNRAQRPGALQEGGRLQVMALDFLPAFNVDLALDEDRFGVVRHNVDPADPRSGALAAGRALPAPGGQPLRGRRVLVRRHRRRGGAPWPGVPPPALGRPGRGRPGSPRALPGERRHGEARLAGQPGRHAVGRRVARRGRRRDPARDGDHPGGRDLRVRPQPPHPDHGLGRRQRVLRAHLLARRADLLPQRPVSRPHVRHHRPLPPARRGAPPRARVPSAAPPLRATGLPGAARAGRASAHHPAGGGRRTASALRPEPVLVGAPGAIVGPLPSQRTKRRSPWPT